MVRSHAVPWLRVAGNELVPATFQSILYAFDHPGAAVHLPKSDGLPWPLNSASAAILAAWINPETPVWTDLDWDSEPAAWLQEAYGGCLVTEPCMAMVALIVEPLRMPSLKRFHIGEDDRPEVSARLILQVDGFSAARAGHRGLPGGRRRLPVAPSGLPRRFWSEWNDQRRLFPLGVDVLFTCADTMVALPRGL